MASGQLRGEISQLRRVVGSRHGCTLTDSQLLERFVNRRDQASFEVLVWRHGTMVLSVCQRILRNTHEAEDAFQATFLVLARKAGSIGNGGALGSWLYKVAYRVALRARAGAARRRPWGHTTDDLPARAADDEAARSDLRRVLDEEIDRLPEKYRRPFVLCYLEGQTNEEAAEQLVCPKGTVLSRLARGRERLRSRLARRGLALSAAALVTGLVEGTASAAVPASLVRYTVEAAIPFAAGTAAAGLVPAPVAALSEGVLRAMFLLRVKIATAALLTLAIAGAGLGLISQRTQAGTEWPEGSPPVVQGESAVVVEGGEQDLATELVAGDVTAGLGVQNLVVGQDRVRGPGLTEVRGTVKSVDAAAGKITIATGGGREQPAGEMTYALAKDVEVAVGSAFSRGSVFKEGKLADLAAGTAVTLTLAADKSTVESVLAEEPTLRGILQGVDAAKGTLTVTLPERARDQAPQEKTIPVAKDAEVVIDDGRGGRFSLKEAQLADLGEGALVILCLSIDGKLVQSVLAEAPTVSGTVKELDAAKKTLALVVRPPRGDDPGEVLSLHVPEDAVVLLDDGRGRRLSVKPGKLADVPAGSVATARLTMNRQVVTSLRAEGPTLFGLLKAVDPAKGTVTVALPKGRGEEPEEKTLTVAKNARIALDGTPSKLTDLKVADDGPSVQLRLSLDQTTVQCITTMTRRDGR
jgi:RNA polymerase sigma factor (sigma-70 family)